MRLSELATKIGAELRNSDSDSSVIEITGVGSPSLADATQLIFAESEAAFHDAFASRAAAILVSQQIASDYMSKAGKPLLAVAQPKLAFARAARLLRPPERPSGVDTAAIVASSARLARDVSIGPGAVIEANASIGARTSIGAGVNVGAGVRMGSDCRLYPRVVLYPGTELGDRVIVHAGAVLGSDGFGYVRDSATGEYTQFPQQGRLIIEDDVEIGANTTIDRGALEETRIGCGTKLDNLVHIGHNVVIGRNVVIAAQTGVSGSSIIGDGAIVGGQVGIADHVEIGPGAILGAQAGIPSGKRIQGPGIVFWGTPARPIKDYLKELATLARLTRHSK
jgi:UDP-3-O-[3-hydroxymyristoyl] glucosamine N-acyltransferase